METTEITVRTLGTGEYPDWDKLVEQSPYGTIFHTSPWLVSVGNDSCVKTDFFGAFLGDQLVGGCVVHSQKFAGLFTSVTTNLPLTPYGGVLIQHEEKISIRKKESDEALIINALLSAIGKTPHLLSLTLSPLVTDIRPYTWQGWVESVNYCYIFPLSGTIEERFSKNVRKSVSKAQKEGIVVRETWDKDMFWKLTVDTYRKQGLQPPYSQRLLFSLLDIIQKNRWGTMWVAETADGTVTAAEVIIWDNKMAYRWLVASDDQYKGTGAPTFLACEAMKGLQEKGFLTFNMMAANTPNFARFASGFNPNLAPYYTVTKSGRLFRMLKGLRLIVPV